MGYNPGGCKESDATEQLSPKNSLPFRKAQLPAPGGGSPPQVPRRQTGTLHTSPPTPGTELTLPKGP